VVIVYSSKDASWQAMAMIDRPPGCKPRLLEWNATDSSKMQEVGGRFVNIYADSVGR
jgi:hypothetical protein